jgi:hypothetical protein
MIFHTAFTLLFLLCFQFIAVLINLPLVAWNVRKVLNRNHMYDATEIFRTLGQHKKECFLKLGFYLLSFCASGLKGAGGWLMRASSLLPLQNDPGVGSGRSSVRRRSGRKVEQARNTSCAFARSTNEATDGNVPMVVGQQGLREGLRGIDGLDELVEHFSNRERPEKSQLTAAARRLKAAVVGCSVSLRSMSPGVWPRSEATHK